VRNISSKAISRKRPIKEIDTQTLKKQVRALHKEILGFTRGLIRIATENPPGTKYKECIELIAQRLKRFGLQTKVVRVRAPGVGAQPRYCLLASYGKGKRTVYFHGHYDVVPAVGRHQFDPELKGAKLYGRGSSDMKGGLASMIYAVRALQLVDVELPGRVCLVIVPDEETGGRFGTQFLFEHGHIKKENGVAMLMPEPTSGAVWNACRGAISLLIRVKGKPIHAVLQHRGINAFEQMVSLTNALRKIKKTVEERQTQYAVAPGESKNSILMLGGTCRCGTNFNTVPGECRFSVERRINPEEKLHKERARMTALLNGFKKDGMNIEIEILQQGEPSGISSDHPVADALVSSIKSISGKSVRFYMCPGLLETRYYLREGIPAYAYGPGMLRCAHSPNEFIQVTNIYDCAFVYALTALKLLSAEKTS
jgi:acetylornithine deacetylase/succinyl-diaminopimelate desuccinylase family protein